ncbi:PAS domain-containing protein [Radicibacter daui]|uniref:PAS domain-containing protein n=1 Tax=Radicibacter daui TaxID=3064829 RepID=UPI004046BD1B
MPINYLRLHQMRDPTATADQVAARVLEVNEQIAGAASSLLQHPVNRRLCEWWEERSASGPVLRRTFDPTLLGRNMRDIYLVRRTGEDGRGFVLRIVGERIADIVGFDNTGAVISPDSGPEADRGMAAYYEAVMASGRPSLCRGFFNRAGFPRVPFEAIDCPLWEPDADTAASLVGCLLLLHPEG